VLSTDLVLEGDWSGPATSTKPLPQLSQDFGIRTLTRNPWWRLLYVQQNQYKCNCIFSSSWICYISHCVYRRIHGSRENIGGQSLMPRKPSMLASTLFASLTTANSNVESFLQSTDGENAFPGTTYCTRKSCASTEHETQSPIDLAAKSCQW
jgi:hypothetical protein